MPCKGICERFRAKKPMPFRLGISRYASGQKRCQVCEVWMSWEGTRCPCCSIKLRGRPRRRDGKVVYKEQEQGLRLAREMAGGILT